MWEKIKMAKAKDVLILEYDKLPRTLLITLLANIERCNIIGLTEKRVKVRLYDLIHNGYDISSSCDRHGIRYIMWKNGERSGQMISLPIY